MTFGLLERLAGQAAHLDFHGVVAGERNRHALAALSPDVDVVLIWGSGHVRGFAAGVRKAGYRHQAIPWVRVGRVAPALDKRHGAVVRVALLRR